MLSALKQKLEAKKQRNKAIVESQYWKNHVLLQDCLQALRGRCTVAPIELHEAMVAVVNIALREDTWRPLEKLIDIPAGFLSETVYIVWDNAKIPVLKVPRDLVMEHLPNVTAVAFETFLVSETMDRVVHFRRENIRLYSVAPEY